MTDLPKIQHATNFRVAAASRSFTQNSWWSIGSFVLALLLTAGCQEQNAANPATRPQSAEEKALIVRLEELMPAKPGVLRAPGGLVNQNSQPGSTASRGTNGGGPK